MTFIPEKHKKYDLLLNCRKHGGEVFDYPSVLLDKINAYLPEGETLDPYGYASYEEYYTTVEKYRDQYALNEETRTLFLEFLVRMKEMNDKEYWFVVRYIGESDERITGIKKGRTYYWPCNKHCPEYSGVIDEEEYTSYWYSTEPEDWEILDDPTGMAARTINNQSKSYVSRQHFEHIMKQVNEVLECKLRCFRTGFVNNIGSYNRQFECSSTEFCKFDKFLFSGWKKDEIEFGNAVIEGKQKCFLIRAYMQ